MSDYFHYVPILKGLIGEARALKAITKTDPGFEIDQTTDPDAFTPLIDVPPVGWDFERLEPAKSIDEHLARVSKSFCPCWNRTNLIFFDLFMVQEHEVMKDGRHPLTYLTDHLRIAGIRAVPVTGLTRNEAYQKAVSGVVARDSRGICLRIYAEDFENIKRLKRLLKDILSRMALKPADADVILDLRFKAANEVATTALAARAMLRALPAVASWRTLTLAASAFPTTLADVTAGTPTIKRRAEWLVWQRIAARKDKVPRVPAFGDYAICHPDYPESIDPRKLKISANLRYTTHKDWLILKSRNVRDHGYGQFNDLCKTLVGRTEYCGMGYSWGDGEIYTRSIPGAKATTPWMWRAIGTSHHIAFVTRQLASLSGA